MERLFVYGTLKRGKRNAAWMDIWGFHFLKEVITEDAYMMVLVEPYRSFPGLLENGKVKAKVKGEIWVGDDIAVVDRFEMVGTLYLRKMIKLDDGNKAWCYFLLGDDKVGEVLPISNGIFNF